MVPRLRRVGKEGEKGRLVPGWFGKGRRSETKKDLTRRESKEHRQRRGVGSRVESTGQALFGEVPVEHRVERVNERGRWDDERRYIEWC